MSYTTTNFDLISRILLGVFSTLIVIGIICFIIVRKIKNKIKVWYTPIGISYVGLNKNTSIFKTDYKWFFITCLIFVVYWFSGYLIPCLIYMAKYSNIITSSGNGSILFFYNPNLITSGNTLGGFEAIFADKLNTWQDSVNVSNEFVGQNNIEGLQLILKQTNVAYYMYYVEFYKIYSTLIENNLLSDAKYMVEMFYRNVNYSNPSEIFIYGYTALQKINNFNINAFNLELQNNLMLWLHSWIYSNVFLTPLCQAFAIILPVSILLSYKKDYASFFAPWGFLGGIITLFGGIVAEDSIHVSASFIFYDEQMFFMYHFFILTMGLSWIAYNQRYSLKRILYLFVPMLIYVTYILIVSHIFNIQYFTTGLTSHDLTVGGSYVIVQQVLANAKNLNVFPVNTILMILVFVTFLLLVISIKNFIQGKYYCKHHDDKKQTFTYDLIQLKKTDWKQILNFQNKIKQLYKSKQKDENL